ncbi:MarR family transcriptional regulator [Terrabacter sp. NPDC080008]|uniref:MarR family winged helix-turn-helix transcriptional regulator n=1 Tax=Terrabacter sp. NPDC080008 TaxID=3155176 RepID=UPI00344C7839
MTSARALVGIALRSVNASPVEVTLMQHRVLVLLAAEGEQSVSMLADELGVNASNASRVCDRLQRLGLVARRRSTTDARSVKIALTTQGLEVVNAVDERRRREIRDLLGSLEPESGRYVVAALRTFNEAAHESARADWVVPGQGDRAGRRG